MLLNRRKYDEDDLTQTDWFRAVTSRDNSIEVCTNKVDLIKIDMGSEKSSSQIYRLDWHL